MKQQTKQQRAQQFWPKVVIRKWFKTKEKEFSADSDDEYYGDTDSENEEVYRWPRASQFNNEDIPEDVEVEANDSVPKLKRRNSETFRAQYINTKEIKVNVATWNVGGKPPPDDIEIDEWLGDRDPADMYVIGFQEIVPLNAGNIFGPEDTNCVVKWEDIIRETLNRVRPQKTKVKCHSDPPSPSRYNPTDDTLDIEDETTSESDSDGDAEVYPLEEELDQDTKIFDARETTNEYNFSNSGYSNYSDDTNLVTPIESDLQKQYFSPKKLNRLNCLRTEDNLEDMEVSVPRLDGKLTRMLTGSERIGLSWPEPPLPLLSQNKSEKPNSFKSIKSFRSKSFRKYSSFKLTANDMQSDIDMLAQVDLESLMNRKRKSSFVRIVSKKMVGIFLTIWVRRSLRRHIQNIKVSTVGVGVMGYIGNKGSVSVSMSIYQTLFCFVCTHLTSGEKDGDEIKRNNDVHEIHRRTQFHSLSSIGLPRSILDHERIIWLGDLNYRINLPYKETRQLISEKDWAKLLKNDQLTRELKKGHAFDGWSEGSLNFPPTYKYEHNSENYFGEDLKAGRRNPAWCDRVLTYGKGMRQISYRRTELKFSDHRPVTATYIAEVEEFSPRKLQRALTFTDAEMERDNVIEDTNIDFGMCCLRLGENNSHLAR